MAFHKDQIVIYEGRRCQIVELTAHTAKLKNLNPKDESDWTTLGVMLLSIKEEE